MKIALLTDYILRRDYFTETLELFIEALYGEHDIEIYTFAHNQGQVLGSIEKCKIISTYLSHMITDENDFYARIHHLPGLAKKFHVNCETDIVISLTRGFAQGIKIPQGTPHHCYLHDMDIEPRGFLSRLLFSGVKNWVQSSFSTVTDIHYNSKVTELRLNHLLKNKEAKKIPGEGAFYKTPIRLEDYPNWEMTKDNSLIIDGEFLNFKDYSLLQDIQRKTAAKLIVLGSVGDKKLLSKENEGIEFWGERCSGEAREILAKAHYFISFRDKGFPGQALCALAMKTPIITLDTSDNREFIHEENGIFINKKSELPDRLTSLISQNYSGSKLRNNALQFNPSRLKIEISNLF